LPGIGARSRGDAEVAEVSALFDELFPVCRSILGPGLRHSLAILRRVIPLDVEAVASGERVFD
jgi:aminopeptidase-like protein